METKIPRRAAFMRIVGLGMLAMAPKSFGGFLGLFGNKNKGLEPDSTGAVKLSLQDKMYEQLKTVGTSMKIEVKGKSKPIIVTRKDENTVLAVSSKCTHMGCEVAPKDGKFICPCHGATFEIDGTVVKGPAKKNLEVFKAEVDNETISIFI
jgi:cytochrome b6-f complex iron-sulfur subunit